MISGGTYHVMNRGNRKCVIFEDDRDRQRFSRLLIDTACEYEVEIAAETQMHTHFHIVVVTPHGNISAFMQAFEGQFAKYSNWRHHRVGHLFQGPFKCVVIENDIHLFTAIWYVFNNPIQSGLVERLEDWPWSTYAATAGFKPAPEYLSLSWMRTLFPAESFEVSQQLFRRCMEDNDPLAAYMLSVNPTLVEAVRSYVFDRLKQMKEPLSYRELFRPPLAQLFEIPHTTTNRNDAIVEARHVHGYRVGEIAHLLALDPSTVGKICRAHRKCFPVPGLTPKRKRNF